MTSLYLLSILVRKLHAFKFNDQLTGLTNSVYGVGHIQLKWFYHSIIYFPADFSFVKI